MQTEIRRALEVLRAGGVILYPTDTLWGIGCDATDEKAVKRIYDIKGRPQAKSMLVLVDSMMRVWDYVEEVPEMARTLTEMSHKPLTIIYPEAKNLAPNLPAEDRSVGIRVTREVFSKTLCERLGKPIVSTSANVSGEPAPRSFAQIADPIKRAVDYVVDFRRHEAVAASPSSVIKLDKGNVFKIIRP